MKVIKRSGAIEDYNEIKITNAIQRADAGDLKDQTVEIVGVCSDFFEKIDYPVTVEQIHEYVEDLLMDYAPKTAKSYIRYRAKKKQIRESGQEKTYKFFTKEFLSKYKHLPDPLNEIGSFVFYRTYSRYLENEGRRERFWETVARAVDYNMGLSRNSTKEEAELLFKYIYEGKLMLSGRTLFTGGSKVSELSSIQNFNCAFIAPTAVKDFGEIFYVLMLGTGVGAGLERKYTNQLPKFRTDIQVINKEWTFTPKKQRQDVTQLIVKNNIATIIVGDSKEGFQQAIDYFLEIHSHHYYRTINTILIDYDYVRPEGERLLTFGGRASGYRPLQRMFMKIKQVLTSSGGKLQPIDVMDIITTIAENVVSGAVRRSACIMFIDPGDEDLIHAKDNIYVQTSTGNWEADEKLLHRMMSNNSIIYHTKPTRQELHEHLQTMKMSGEPGMINGAEAKRRFKDFKGCNPCVEILLDNKEVCNLTTINMLSFVDKDGSIDHNSMQVAQELSARAGYRMTLVDLELPEWDKTLKRDRLTGCSLTGWQDFVEAAQITEEDQELILWRLRKIAHNANEQIAKEHNLEPSVNVTALKPEGTLSLVFGGVSPGVHASHAPYYIRRIRISATDPLVKVCEELGWNVKNEVGQEGDEVNTKVVEFPVHSPATKTKSKFSAVEQLNVYKMFQTNYTDQNTSITVTVANDEWDKVEEWLWENWDIFVGISFLAEDGGFYQLMPYEEIDESVYNKMAEKYKPFNPNLISQYESSESDFEDLEAEATSDPECASGLCPIR